MIGLLNATKQAALTGAADERYNLIKSKLKSNPERSYKVLQSIAVAIFCFCDREESCTKLADCLNQRHSAWLNQDFDKQSHPLPFVADGPGSGKSRFLQELTCSFKDFVTSGVYPDEFKEKIATAKFINISFGNGWPYSTDDVEMCIEKSICLRIIKQFDAEQARPFVINYI